MSLLIIKYPKMLENSLEKSKISKLNNNIWSSNLGFKFFKLKDWESVLFIF